MIKITRSAITEIKRILDNLGKSQQIVCLSVRQGGCCDLSYVWEFIIDEAEKIVWEEDGVKVAIAPEYGSILENIKIDYLEDLMGGQFCFENPQAIATCSCSQSFSVLDTNSKNLV